MGATQAVTSAAVEEFETYYQDGRPRWRHLESGRTGWVIGGGDGPEGEGGAAAPEPAADPAPEPAAAEPEPAAPAAEADPYEGWDEAKFRAEHARLKKENVSYKERFRPYEQAFDGVDVATATNLASFAKALGSDDPKQVQAAVTWMQDALKSATPAEAEAIQEVADAATGQEGDDEFDPFDREAIRKLAREEATAEATRIAEEREAARQKAETDANVAREMDEFVAELADTHDIPELKDSKSREFGLLFQEAGRLDPELPWKDRLSAAAENVIGWRNELAQKYLTRKSAEADVPASPPEGGEPSGTTPPRTIKDATKSAEERLKRLGQPAGTR